MPATPALLPPVLFVLLWSTGFIFTKYGLPYAEPFTFLAIRFGIVVLILLIVVLVTRATWPQSWAAVFHIVVAGVFAHAIYLGGAFAGMATGVNAGISALLVGVQPLLTAVLAGPMLGERVTARQWTGLGLGFIGVWLVVSNSLLDASGETAISLAGFLWHMLALFGITMGVLYQKRFCADMNLRTGSLIQFTAATALVAIAALLFEDNSVEWTGKFLFSLGWLVLVLSIGAMTLLWVLVRHDAASNVASLFYLVPPVTALIAWFMFGDIVTLTTIAGMVVVATAIILINTTGRRPRA